jgi:hypothetical protein
LTVFLNTVLYCWNSRARRAYGTRRFVTENGSKAKKTLAGPSRKMEARLRKLENGIEEANRSLLDALNDKRGEEFLICLAKNLVELRKEKSKLESVALGKAVLDDGGYTLWRIV